MAIQGVRESGMDMTGWLEYFVNGLSIQMHEVKELGERIIKLDILVQKHRLTDRQRAALRYALEHGGLTIHEFGALYKKVNRRTLQREIKGLVDNVLLIPEGSTNKLIYRREKG